MTSKMFSFAGALWYFSIEYNGKTWSRLQLVNVNGMRAEIKTYRRPGYAISITQKAVYADDAALGAFRFFCDCINNDFMMDYVFRVVRIWGGVAA